MHLPVRICQVLIWLVVLQFVVCQDHCCGKLKRRMRREIKQSCTCKRKLECPFGFMRYKGVCYWFIMGNYNVTDWWGARNICRNHGGNLVTVNEKRREVFIHNYLQANFQNIGSPLKMFTGLIYTDNEGHNPYYVLRPGVSSESSSQGHLLRWSSTGEFVKWKGIVSAPVGKQAKWAPHIEGHVHGPNMDGQMYLSCVVLIWHPRAGSKLTWHFNDCTENNLALICEVRIGQSKAARPKRSATSHYSEIFGIHNHEDARPLDEDNELIDLDDNDDDDEL